MTTWILTTGNSDIQLKNTAHFKNAVQMDEQLFSLDCSPQKLENSQNLEVWTVLARALGLAYDTQLDSHYDDLHFPLLDNFYQTLQDQKININKVYFIVTDQSNIFSPNDLNSDKCPYWKDTVTLQTIFTKYLKEKIPHADIKSIVLKPQEKNQGLDHWNSTLSLVRDELSTLTKVLAKEKVIYVSHQAGTPAISSALQFITLSNFGNKVKFLLGNEYNESTSEIVESSEYLRGIKIQQAKSLVRYSPGAAQRLLDNVSGIEETTQERLSYYVNFFNLNKITDDSDNELTIKAGTQRIVDALDLISIFISQENYLQAIALLSAAQETFLKVAILQKTAPLTIKTDSFSGKGSDVLSWTRQGLLLKKFVYNKSIDEINNILKQTYFPDGKFKITETEDNKEKRNFHKTNDNSIMLIWLKRLEPKFEAWKLLDWYCQHYRDRDLDLRNQLIHNLCGIEKSDIVNYLIGYKSNLLPNDLRNIASQSDLITNDHIIGLYNAEVKTKFFNALNILQLIYLADK
jgi:hypothetical protein